MCTNSEVYSFNSSINTEGPEIKKKWITWAEITPLLGLFMVRSLEHAAICTRTKFYMPIALTVPEVDGIPKFNGKKSLRTRSNSDQ